MRAADAGRTPRPPEDALRAEGPGELPDPLGPLWALYRDLRTSPRGLPAAEAARRQLIYGPNLITRRAGRHRLRELGAQFTQPLAVLLAAAAVLAWVGGSPALSAAVVAVIVLNAGFAFAQEMQAEHAVEALAAYLPDTAQVLREGEPVDVPARDLVPGDVVLVTEGDRVSADARIISGAVLMDLSALTGESRPVARSAEMGEPTENLIDAGDLIFSGTSCVGGELRAVITRTGMHSELGRIAALSQRGRPEPSPLERQVRRATWVIAAVAVAVAAAFLPAGLAAGMGFTAAISFSIGLLVANVPEGLLPTITLALALGVRQLARSGAVVKRLAAVETLGSTTVVCTDKTGTLTENRMRVRAIWVPGGESDLDAAARDPRGRALALAAARCTSAHPPSAEHPDGSGDPMELALLAFAAGLGCAAAGAAERDASRRVTFHFEPRLQRMATVDALPPDRRLTAVHVKGAPESVLPSCSRLAGPLGRPVVLDEQGRAAVAAAVEGYASTGLRVLAVAHRLLEPGEALPSRRAEAEHDLTLLGLVALLDPPRAGVAEAVRLAHRAGIRVHVISGDHGLTAAEIAAEVGIGRDGRQVVAGRDVDRMTGAELDALLASPGEIVFARTSPESKLRICEALRGRGEIVAMTGDGVNDAPALRHADIGVAMGRSGTDIAREAATMVLTDDNFATIIAAVEAGRRVFTNVKKFVLYIFAHAVPEAVPFLIFALSGGRVPLPLTVLQILAIDLGTETLPALALGREPAEPDLMSRPPRSRREGVIDRNLLFRAWAVMGTVSAVLVLAGFFTVLWWGGWHPGAPTGTGSALHEVYRQATSITFAGIVSCQVGTAFAARTERASLFTVGLWSNPMLLWGIAFELAFTAVLIYVPPLQPVFGTAALAPSQLALTAPFPLIVWGVDELVRRSRRRRSAHVSRPSSLRQ